MPVLGGGLPVGLGGLGVEPGRGLLDQPAQLRRADLVRERRDLGVHEPRRVRGQAQGALGDEPQPPRRQLTGLQPGPAPWEPVEPLDRVREVAAPGLGGPAHRRGELDDRELRHLRTPLATQRQAGLVPLIDRPDQRLDRVHRRPPDSSPQHLTSGVVLDPLLCPRVRQHTGWVVCSQSWTGSKVEVIVGPTQPPATDTRRPGIPLSTRDSATVTKP